MTNLISFDNLSIATEDLGELWTNFENCNGPETTKLFNTAYNLIASAVQDSGLSDDINIKLIDETLDIPQLVNEIRNIFLMHLVDLANTIGIIIDKEYVDSNSLPDLILILNTITQTDIEEDSMGLLYVLDNETLDNKDKYIKLITKINSLDDEGMLPYIIKSVSSDVIKGIYIGLGGMDEDDKEYINEDVAIRIKNNKEFLKSTLGGEHIIDGGIVGLPFESLSRIFDDRLASTLLNNGLIDYFKQTLSLSIISSMTDNEIKEGFEVMIKDHTESLEDIYKSSKLLDEVKLKDE